MNPVPAHFAGKSAGTDSEQPSRRRSIADRLVQTLLDRFTLQFGKRESGLEPRRRITLIARAAFQR
jgi:hypothetical protein